MPRLPKEVSPKGPGFCALIAERLVHQELFDWGGERRQVICGIAQLAGGSGGMEIYACSGDKDRVFDAMERAASLGPIRIGWFLLKPYRTG